LISLEKEATMVPFRFDEIEGMSGWAFLLVLILFALGFFALPVLLAVGAVWGLALLFKSRN
jgi:hypothetical protein